MKINNKGFAITTIMYIILLFAVVAIALTLALLSSRKLILDKIKSEVADSINNTCVLVSGTPNTIGSKYKCEVKPGVVYNFYVLSYNDEDNNTIYDKSEAVTTNLIMDRNICRDGTEATADNKCLVAWISSEEYCRDLDDCNGGPFNDKGPITAMSYLYEATSSWTNVPPLNYEYKDKEWQESLGITFQYSNGYESFISKEGILTITGINTTIIGTSNEPLRARMPIYTVNGGVEYGELTGCDFDTGIHEDSYLSDNLREKFQINGYWTLSTYEDSYYAILGGCMYYVNDVGNLDSPSGVRPVINLEL